MIIDEGIGRGVGFEVKEADRLRRGRCEGFEVKEADGARMGLAVIDALMLGLQIGASAGQSKSVGSQQSASCPVGIGVIDAEGEQTGANDGHVINRGSQHASGGIEGSPVPPPGGHSGTKSGQGNFAGSQHAPAGNEGIGVFDALCEGQIGTTESVHCIRVGSQHASRGRLVTDAEGQMGAPTGQSIFIGSQHCMGG